MKNNKYGLVNVGKLDEYSKEEPGWSYWIEWGNWYKAPTVDKEKFGPHTYAMPGKNGMGTCELCGCYMGESSSSGLCDPFGACPENPIPQELHNLN